MKQFLKFALVGAAGTVLNLLVLYALTEYAGVYYLISASVAFLVAVTSNFILNKIWTFEEVLYEEAPHKFAKFFVVSLCALMVNLAVLYALTQFFGLYYILSQVAGIAVALVINFFGNKLWTFQKKSS